MIANLDSICEGILMLEDVKGIQEDIFKMELELFQLKNILFIYNVISQSIHIQNNLNISSFAVTKQQTNKNSENGSKMPKINNNFKIKMSQNRKIKTKKRQKLLRVKLLSDLNDKITINSYKINNIFFIKMDI